MKRNKLRIDQGWSGNWYT